MSLPSHPLSTAGRRIVGPDGTTVRLRAVNWSGAQSSTYVPHGLWNRNYKELLDQVADWGFNCLRIPFSGDTFREGKTISLGSHIHPSNKDLISGYGAAGKAVGIDSRSAMDVIIRYAAAKGLYVVLDHHSRHVSEGMQMDGSPVGPDYQAADWVATWKALATRYKDQWNVIGADLHNEPWRLTWQQWASYAEIAGNAIHSIAPDWLIFVEGVRKYADLYYCDGGQLMGVADRPVRLQRANKVVYSPHDYGQSANRAAGAFQSWLSFSDRHSAKGYPGNLPQVFRKHWGFIAESFIAPIWIGEFGGKFGLDVNGRVDPLKSPDGVLEEQWLDQLVNYMNQYGISFSYWGINPNSEGTHGLLTENWAYPIKRKLDLLQRLF